MSFRHPPSNFPSTLNQVLWIGQSLAGGYPDPTLLSVEPQNGTSWMFNGGCKQPMQAAAIPTSWQTYEPGMFREIVRHGEQNADILHLFGETAGSGFADWISKKTSGAHPLLSCNASVGSSAYTRLQKRIPQPVSITASGTTTATVTLNGHGLVNGDEIIIRGSNTFYFNGMFTVSGAATNTFNITTTYAANTTDTAVLDGDIYNWGIYQVKRAKELCKVHGVTHNFRALLSVHGENDIVSSTYDTMIRQWQSDFQSDIQLQTGQTGVIPMFHSQVSAFTSAQTPNSSLKMLAEHEAEVANGLNAKTLLVGPKYFITHAADNLHLTPQSYRRLGWYYARAYWQHVISGTKWEPVRISSISVNGGNTVITITLTGGNGVFTSDTVNVTDPGSLGFRVFDGATGTNEKTITSVVQTAPTQFQITISSAATAGTNNRHLTYAMNASAGQTAGPTTGPRGCIRDTSTDVSFYDNSPLYNWACHQDKAF